MRRTRATVRISATRSKPKTPDDLLMFELGGPDADSFGLSTPTMGTNSVHLQTKAALDYETKSEYTVTITAKDSTGASDTITVTVMVTNENDGAVITPNRAPVFDDGETAEREVAENSETGTPVGDPVTATDADGNDLTYELGGDDAMYFAIDDTGQITVGAGTMLDYESDKTMYMVMVTADDGAGSHNATASIAVTIMVTDVNDIAPMFDDDAVELAVAETAGAGMPVGDPVMATDAEGDDLAYSLGGDDAMYFAIDDMGQITVGEGTMLDYESDKTVYMVTVTASDGEHDASIMVTINVENAYPGCDTVGNMGLVSDCEALLGSEDALGGSLNWADDTPMSDWDGVTMSGDRVTAVNLRDQGLDGTIPAALGRLSELTSLNLRSNADLSGEIPGSLNYLSNLTVLNLHSNSHTGEIPDLSGTSLVELYLPGNDLTGSVPAWLNTMTDMTELWLWGNNLSGTMPDLSGMTSLDKLKLNGNTALTGIDAAMLPSGLRWLIIGQTDVGANAPDLSGMTSLTTLWMNETGLSGAIPVASIPTSVTSLNLKDNMLSGDDSGHERLGQPAVLLRLHRNDLSGDIPGTLGDLESIERIWMYENDLTGIAAGFAERGRTP